MLHTSVFLFALLLTGNAVADAQAVGHRVKVNGMDMSDPRRKGDPVRDI